MSSIDDRIVNMQFNNKQFTQGAAESVRALDSVDQSIAKAGKNGGLSQMGQALDQNTSKFGAMKIAGITAIATIANKVTNLGLGLAKSLTLDPLTQGFQEYQTNLNSIQTILANTGAPLKTVQGALNQLNHYSDQTIYNFTQMAENIGRFTAAGVKIKDAVPSIKGMANTAALSGASVMQLNTAMYQVSQALATGVLRLQDWNSLANANMGGKNIQNALKATATTMSDNGKVMEDAIKKQGSFRNSLTEGWLTADIYNKTMKVMAGTTDKATGKTVAFSLAQLKAMGYTQAQAKELNRLSQASIDSATVIKTLPQLMDVVKESIGSVWSQSFSGIFGNFNQSKQLWTSAGNAITSQVSKINIALNGANGKGGLIGDWAKQGGRNATIEGFKNGFVALGKVLGAVKMAFQDVFPPGAGSALASISKNFASFTAMLIPSQHTLSNLVDIFGGLFAVLHIIFTVVKAVGAAFGGFFDAISAGTGKAGGGILDLLANVGDMLKALDKFITSGGKMISLFHSIGEAAGTIAGKGISIVTGIIMGIVSGISGSGGQIRDVVVNLATNLVDWIKGALGIHSPAAELVPVGIAIVQGIVQGIIGSIGFIFNSLGKIAGAILSGFGQAFKGMNALDFAALLNSILTAGVLITINRISFQLKNFSAVFLGLFSQLGSTLKTFQDSLRAKALKDIALSVGILAASLIALSFVDPKKVGIGIAAMGAMMAELVGALAGLSKISKSGLGLNSLAASMVLMATAMGILSGAVTLLGQLDVTTLAKGIGALAFMLAEMSGAMILIGSAGPITLKVGPALLAMATAMNILAGAIALLGNMDLKTLAKGFITINLAMGLFVGALLLLTAVSPGVAAAGAGILLVATAMSVLAVAVAAFGNMDMKTLAVGFAAVTTAIVIFTAALVIMGGNVAGTLGAAAAMVLMATAMAMLVPVILALGSMDLGTLIKGLLGLVGVMAIFVVGLAAMAAVAVVAGPALLILGGALALIGIGMAAFGAGFALLAATGTAGIAVMTAAITAFIGLLPAIAIQMAAAVVQFVEVIAQATPRLRAAFDEIFVNIIGVITDNIPVIGGAVSKLLAEMLKVIIDAIPQVGDLFLQLINTALRVLRGAAADVIDTAWFILTKFLSSIRNHLPDVIATGVDIIVAWIGGIAKGAVKIANAAADAIVAFLQGLSKAIDSHSKEFGKAGADIGISIAKGIITGLAGMAGEVANAAADLGKNALGGLHKIIKNPPFPSREGMALGASLGYGFATGISTYSKTAESNGSQLANGVIDKMVIAMQRMSDVVPDEVNLDPVITPVIDLSKVKNDASKIDTLLSNKSIVPTLSIDQASVISASQTPNSDSSSNGQNGSETKVITFNYEQHNTSPESLSTVEIYRRTNSQLSEVKNALQLVTSGT